MPLQAPAKIAPKTHDSSHVFYNTTVFGTDDKRIWNDGKYAVLEHTTNNCKLYIDASRDAEIAAWKNSSVSYQNVVIGNSQIAFGTAKKDFATYYNAHTTVPILLEYNFGIQNRRIVTYIDSSNVIHPLSKYDGTQRSDVPTLLQNKYSNYAFNTGQLKFVPLSLSTWQAAAVSSIAFTTTSATGTPNQVITAQVQVKDSNNFGVESAPVYFFIQSGITQQIIHSHGLYSLTDVNGFASAQVVLKYEGITDIKAYVNSANELISSTYEISCITTETEIYIRNAAYNTLQYVDDYKAPYNELQTIFAAIPNFTWQEIGFCQADVLNANNSVSYQMMIFIKGAIFQNASYLTLQQSLDLRTAIYNALILEGAFTFQDIEIRSYKRFVNITS